MIALIHGLLVYKSVNTVIVEANGVGYLIYIPLTTYYELPEAHQPVTLHIHTHVRNDAINLFGFSTVEERNLFQLMITVSGIGPKLAVNILSGISAAELKEAIVQRNLGKLVCIPGVGKKTAERMIIELNEKVLKHDGFSTPVGHGGEIRAESLRNDALSALINLGYKSHTVKKALDTVFRETVEPLSLDVLLKEALKVLSRT